MVKRLFRAGDCRNQARASDDRFPPLTDSSMSADDVRHFRWSEMPEERVTDVISRRLITGDQMMLAHVYLKKGALVPQHAHHNEQLTYILEGALEFRIGADRGEVIIVRAGEVLVIPGNVPHEALALEDTLDVDVFDPPRQDWLDGTDSYFHRK